MYFCFPFKEHERLHIHPKILENYILEFFGYSLQVMEENQFYYFIKLSDIIFRVAIKPIMSLGINLTRKVMILYKENYKSDCYTWTSSKQFQNTF